MSFRTRHYANRPAPGCNWLHKKQGMPRESAPERESPWRIAGVEAASWRLATILDRWLEWPLAGVGERPVREPGVSGEPGIRECRPGLLRRRYQWRGPSQKRKEPLPVLPATTQSTPG